MRSVFLVIVFSLLCYNIRKLIEIILNNFIGI